MTTNDWDDRDEECTRAAAEAAVETLEAAFDVDADEVDWMLPTITDDDGDLIPVVRLTVTRDERGEFEICPNFTFEEALDVVPREVSVTLKPSREAATEDESDDSDEIQCTHAIQVEHQQGAMD